MQISMNYECYIDKEIADNKPKTLNEAQINTQYVVKDISTNDSELKNFLFTLGCYEGEKITLISKLSGNFVINIKNARYSIDDDLAKAILLK